MDISQTPDVLDRFLRYVKINTTSSEAACDQTPSTQRQFDLATLLAHELQELGCQDVRVDDHAYVTAHVAASAGAENLPRLGLIAHLDTTEVAPGAGVSPHIVSYRGGNLVAGTVDGKEVSIGPDKVPALADLVGEEIVCTDGTTLLGGDDKAGIAEIMSLVARLSQNSSIPHPALGICFCPDEEIGHGAELLDVEGFGCAYAYTVDGGPIGELEWECFNAAEAIVTFDGYSIHPGDAKNRMVNATNLFTEFHALLPQTERPEHTECYEGFFHIEGVSSTVDHATARYIVRDHDGARFEQKIERIARAAAFMNQNLGEERVHVEIVKQYRNMAEIVAEHPELIDIAQKAFQNADVEAHVIPIRGGTDGAQLSFRGLPCPNLSTGAYCCHGVNEFVPVSSLVRMVDVLEQLVRLFAARA